jgi:flagellar biosynthetic protein FlhB
MAQTELDRTEQPTAFRLEEARKKGQVARSADLSGALMLLAFSVVLVVTADRVARALAGTTLDMLRLSGSAAYPGDSLLNALAAACKPLWQACEPLLLTLIVAAVAVNVLQVGGVASFDPLKPDFSRLSPARAFKRVFSRRSLWETGKLLLKAGLLAALCYHAWRSLIPWIESAARLHPRQLPEQLLHAFIETAAWMLLILLILGLGDWLFARRDYIRELRMSRREIKDEVRRREGDPRVRAKRRRLIAELLKRTHSVRRVPDSDVVLTNPTHIAVALRYRPRSMRAPIVLAKGADHLAARMRLLAVRHGVPQLRSPALARSLFQECKLDEPVPPHLFQELAPVYRWLLSRPGQRVQE